MKNGEPPSNSKYLEKFNSEKKYRKGMMKERPTKECKELK